MKMTEKAKEIFRTAILIHKRSAFNPSEVLKVAERISSLDHAKEIKADHMAEAINYYGDIDDYIKEFVGQNLGEEYMDRRDYKSLIAFPDSPEVLRLTEIYGPDIKKRLIEVINTFIEEKK